MNFMIQYSTIDMQKLFTRPNIICEREFTHIPLAYEQCIFSLFVCLFWACVLYIGIDVHTVFIIKSTIIERFWKNLPDKASAI